MSEPSLLQNIIIWAVPVIFAITVHEVAHGWVANYLGDATAKSRGRLTLNPVKHIDPIGTVALPAILILLKSGFVFGWAKPVPVTWQNLRSPRRDMALVAIAGPMANLMMLLLWALLAKLLLMVGPAVTPMKLLLQMCGAGILVNVVLMVLNLFPILPLDGGRVMTSMLPIKLARIYARLEPYGLVLIIVLLATGILGNILIPIVSLITDYVYNLVG